MHNWKKVLGATIGIIWAVTVTVPTVLLLEEGAILFFMPEAKGMGGDMSGEIALATFKVFLYLFLAGLATIVVWGVYWWFKRDEGGRNGKGIAKESQGQPYTRFNITINSRDFVNMDTERTKVFFDGLERIERKDTKGDKDK